MFTLLCRQLTASFLAIVIPLATLPMRAQSPASSRSSAPRPDPKRAQKAVNLGEKAETEGRIHDALTFYDQAARYAPQDPAIAARSAALRSKLVRSHVDTAERDAIAGHVLEATKELGSALRIDPGNTIVYERLAQIKAMEADDPPAKSDAQLSGVPKLQPAAGKQNFNLRGDTRTLYDQVTQAFGVKAAFDPDMPSQNVRFNVQDVDFAGALTILTAETRTFWRPVNQTLIFVASDTQEKRHEYGLQAEQTFSLPAAVAPEDMTELLRVLRDITGATHLELDIRSHSITMRDSPEKLAVAGKLIKQVEQARGEVLLEIELLEVDRNKARDLGITPPSSAQLILLTPADIRSLAASKDFTNLITNLTQIFTGKGFASLPAVIPIGGGLTTFLLTLPTAAANFSDTLSLVHSGRQILLRAQDGKPATFFVGDRFPVTLSLLSASLGTSGGFTGIPSATSFPQTVFSAGNNSVALTANTFTGGSLPDLAVTNENDNTITILQNQGGGNFTQIATSPIQLSSQETAPVAIASAVFRNDISKFPSAQPPDLVVVNSASNNVSVLLSKLDPNNNSLTFSEALGSPFPVGKNPSAVVVADFNGDGAVDFAVTNQGDATNPPSLSVFRNDGSGKFTPFPGSPFLLTNTSTVSEKGPVAMVTANFQNKQIPPANNNNGYVTNGNAPEADLAIVNQVSNNVTILLTSVDKNGNVTFHEAPGSPILVQTKPVAIATGDLNADGVPDLAVVNQGSDSVTILLGSSSADATFTQPVGSPLPTASTPAGIVIANFANSAFPDLAVTNQGQGTVGVYLGTGAGTFAQRIELSTPAGPGAIISAVLTNSALPDVAFVAQGTVAKQGVVAVILDSSSLASSAGTARAAQQPYPGSEYIDLGVKVKATPALHDKNEVTLQLEFEIRSLAGANVNGIPVISNRTLTQTVRVKEDETTLIGGLTDREETRSITGLPGFAELPGIGYAFGKRSSSLRDTELLILVTPRRLRLQDRAAQDIFAGRGDTGGRGSVGANVPLGPVPEPIESPQPGQQPPPQPQPQPQQQSQPPPRPQPNPQPPPQ